MMRKNNLLWLSALILLFIILGTIIFPKTVYKSVDDNTVMTCECFGSEFWFGTKCVGFRFDCQETTIKDWRRACEEPSCTEVINKLIDDGSFTREYKNKGTDVLLVIDSSISMEEDKLLAAKQAAQRLVDELKEYERIGVISFSENATIIHDFSDDKKSLTKSIMNITVSGGTKYLPSLELADTMFEQQSSRAKKGVIFLTDGNPSDNESAIIKKANDLEAEDVALFAISFGLAKDETSILEEMILQTTPDGEFKNRFRTFSDTEDIIDAFYDAWQEISNLAIISFEGFDDNLVVMEDQAEFVGFETYLGNTKISLIDHDEALCVPQLSVTATAHQGNQSTNISLENVGDKFFLPTTMSNGTYNVSLEAFFESNHNGSCFFSGEQTVHNLTISHESNSCRLLSCKEVKEVLEDFDLAAQKGAFLPREAGFGRVAILVDTSESMKPYVPQVVRAVDRLSRLFSLGDERALITFSDTASLVVPLTRDKDLFTKSLKNINPQGTTKIMPALTKAQYVFSQNKSEHDIVVLVSDGLTYDGGGEKEVLEMARALVDEDVCVYVFGYGKTLANNPRAADVFRDITKYSSRQLSCGEYVFSPNAKDLSSLVTSMFGGVRPGDETLRVIVDRQASDNAGSFVFDIKVVSAKTGIQLPFVTDNGCTGYPQLQVALVNRGSTIPLQTEYNIDGSIKIITPHLFPGRYSLQVVASLPNDGCDINEEYVEEFVLVGPPADTSEGIVTILIILLAACAIIVSRELLRK